MSSMKMPASALPPVSLANRVRPRRVFVSLTPLIDVVFILLVFFMLASSFSNWRAIELNAPVRAGSGSPTGKALLIEVRPDGLRLAGVPVTRDRLAPRVKERLAQQPELKILIRLADGVVLQEAIAVLDHLTAAGVKDLSLVSNAP